MYNPLPTVTTGDLWTASNHNTYIRDNFAAGVPAIMAAKGDLAVASAPQSASRLAVGQNNQVLLAAAAEALGMVWGRNIVLFQTHRLNTSWDGDSKSIGTSTIAVNSFHTDIPNTAKAIFVSLSARWAAASDGAIVNLRAAGGTGNGILARALLANFFMDNAGVLPLNDSGQFDVVIAGAGPNAVYIDIWGYIL